MNWRVPVAAAMVAAGLSPAIQNTSAHAEALHAPRALMAFAAQHPDAAINVIVQKRDGSNAAEGLVRQVGGRITRNLSLIHAFAARVPARNVRTLAASHSVNWMTPDANTVKSSSYVCCSSAALSQTYTESIGAASLWGRYKGTGIGVAIVDSGVNGGTDLNNANGSNRLLYAVRINSNTKYAADKYGHGTHVAGIVAGDGEMSNGAYMGVAPDANVLNVKVSDDNGAAAVSDVVNGLQWVYNNQAHYNIRVVNLSLNSTVADSYQADPLDAAVETLWKAGIVVVTSAGNNGSTNAGVMYAPANDPFVITVGAVNDQNTASTADDSLASFSAYGSETASLANGSSTTVSKPELVAPGVNIISDLASAATSLATAHPDHVVTLNKVHFFRMSGTSMAVPMVAGAVALLLQSNPSLTPDQVKYRLVATATKLSSTAGTGAGEVNAAAAVASTSTASANAGLQVAASLQPSDPAANWGSASWGSASWGSTNWSSASWGSASWGSVSWGSASWGSASWGSDYWGS